MPAYALPRAKTTPYGMARISLGMLPYRTTSQRLVEPVASVFCLSPDHFRRPVSRRVSYYALFKWWLLLSQHPRCPGN
jgi:hypothetical protein